MGYSQMVKAPAFEAGTTGSSPVIPAKFDTVPEWFKGAVCKTVIRRFESDPYLQYGAIV